MACHCHEPGASGRSEEGPGGRTVAQSLLGRGELNSLSLCGIHHYRLLLVSSNSLDSWVSNH